MVNRGKSENSGGKRKLRKKNRKSLNAIHSTKYAILTTQYALSLP